MAQGQAQAREGGDSLTISWGDRGKVPQLSGCKVHGEIPTKAMVVSVSPGGTDHLPGRTRSPL